jgi:hypothetical protein
MIISPKKVWFDEDSLWVELVDARVIGVPLAWFPKLLDASQSDRLHFELSPGGIHWDALEEDISVSGLLAGHGDMTKKRGHAA